MVRTVWLSTFLGCALFSFSFQSIAYYDDEDYYEESYYDSRAERADSVEMRNDDRYSFVQNDYYYAPYDEYYEPPPPRPRKRGRSVDDDDRPARHSGRMPAQIAPHGEKVIIINPRLHAWGAYDASGNLIRSGTATSGANYCKDVRRGCRTSVGTFRIFSLGSAGCKSSKYPLPRGGAPMPYCMFFNKNQALHGSNQVANANLSHGCVRLHVGDAKWLRFNFANIGTKVIVKPY